MLVDGTEDDNIHCFKKGTTCEAGREKVNDSIIDNSGGGDYDVDPFEITADDVEDAFTALPHQRRGRRRRRLY